MCEKCKKCGYKLHIVPASFGREKRRQQIATMTALVQSPRARRIFKLMERDYELSMIKHRIKERCEKGQGIELTPVEVNYLLAHLREQAKEIERLKVKNKIIEIELFELKSRDCKIIVGDSR